MIKYIIQSKKNPKTQEALYYAQIGRVQPLDINDISRNISEVCTVTRHDILGVLSALQEEIIKALLAGRSVRLGDLGSFRPTLQSSASATAPEVSQANIRHVRAVFQSGSLLRNGLALRNVSFMLDKYAPKKHESGDGGL